MTIVKQSHKLPSKYNLIRVKYYIVLMTHQYSFKKNGMTDNFSASTIFSITFFAWMYATGRSEGIKTYCGFNI